MIDQSMLDVVDGLRRECEHTDWWRSVADTETMLTAAIAIQQIAAPTFHEQQRARYVRDQMRELGLQHVHMDDLHNVYGCLPGQQPGAGVLICAHIDTVFASDVDLAVRREGARVYGPGLGDNSISVAALLHLARVFKQAGIVPARPLWFVANTGEEGLGDLRGMRAAMDELRSVIDSVIVIDAQFGTIVHGGVASRRTRIRVDAPGGHSWQDFGAPSAVHVLARLAARITDLSLPNEPKCTFNIGVIEGGTTVNAIAQHAHLLLDLRSTSEDHLADLIRQVEAIVDTAAAQHEAGSITQETVGDRPGGVLDPNHPLVELARAAYNAVGTTATFEFASTDANVPLSQHVPAVCVGMSTSGNVHREDEYIELEAIAAGMHALVLLVLGAAQARVGTWAA